MNRFTILLFFVDAMFRGARRRNTLDGLLRGLQHQDPFVRRRAASALSMLAYEAEVAAPALIHALGDLDPRVQAEAAIALKRMGPKAVPFLKEHVRQGCAKTRKKVLVLLGLNLPKNPAIRETLEGALGDRDKDVRQAAAWALLKNRRLTKRPKGLRRARCRPRSRRSRSRLTKTRRAPKQLPQPSLLHSGGEPLRLSSTLRSRRYARSIRAVRSSPATAPIALRVSTMSLAVRPSRR